MAKIQVIPNEIVTRYGYVDLLVDLKDSALNYTNTDNGQAGLYTHIEYFQDHTREGYPQMLRVRFRDIEAMRALHAELASALRLHDMMHKEG